MRAKALRAVSISGKGSSCKRPGWPMRPYSRAREKPPNRSARFPAGKTAPVSWQGAASPVRRLQFALSAWLYAARLYDQRREGRAKYPPKPSGLCTGLKIESRGCFSGRETVSALPGPGFHWKPGPRLFYETNPARSRQPLRAVFLSLQDQEAILRLRQPAEKFSPKTPKTATTKLAVGDNTH